MNIHNTGHVSKTHLQKNVLSTRSSDKSAAGSSPVAATESDSVQLSVQDLLASGSQETREGLVSRIRAELQNGNLTTRGAAESAADAILDS